ncbi:hypothetical protein BER47_002587 [Staphylococcus aureus]|nr:hypothetical protein BER47_002587 [Staphylococcus aureus]
MTPSIDEVSGKADISRLRRSFAWGHKKTKCHTFVTQYIAFVTVL